MKIHRISLSSEGYARLAYISALEQISPKDWIEQRIADAWSLRDVKAINPIIQLDDKPKRGAANVADIPQKEASAETRAALSCILSELEKGNEPTVNEVADKMGLTTTGLGRILAACGIKAKNTHRDNKTVRIYTKPMKVQIEEILGKV